MVYNSKKGVTLFELIMAIIILAVFSVVGAHLMFFFMQNEIFIPSQLNMGMFVSDALDIMIEGDDVAKGLRFSKNITDIQDYQIIFLNEDNQTIRYRLDTPTNRLYRSINSGAESPIPYYATSGMSLMGKDDKLFTYYDANFAETADPASVRWITMVLIAKTGSGLYENWEGQSEQTSSIAVKKLQ